MVTRGHMIHLILRNLDNNFQLLIRSWLSVCCPTRAVHRKLPEQVDIIVGLVQQAEAETTSLERVPLLVDTDLIREEHLHHGLALGLLRGTLRKEARAELVGLVVRVVDVVLARRVIGAAFDELEECESNWVRDIWIS